jgi:hypothetical protein
MILFRDSDKTPGFNRDERKNKLKGGQEIQ